MENVFQCKCICNDNIKPGFTKQYMCNGNIEEMENTSGLNIHGIESQILLGDVNMTESTLFGGVYVVL